MDDFEFLFKRMRQYAVHFDKRIPSKWNKFLMENFTCELRLVPNHSQEAHHRHHLFGSFMSKKTSGIFTIPICAMCHEEIERMPRRIEAIEVWMKLAHQFILTETEK